MVENQNHFSKPDLGYNPDLDPYFKHPEVQGLNSGIGYLVWPTVEIGKSGSESRVGV